MRKTGGARKSHGAAGKLTLECLFAAQHLYDKLTQQGHEYAPGVRLTDLGANCLSRTFISTQHSLECQT